MSEVNAEEFRVVNAEKFESMEIELVALREELAETKSRSTGFARSFNNQCRKTDELYQRLTAAEQRNAVLEAELFKLKHAVWHTLDDSGDGEDDASKSIMTIDFDKLCELVPEEWHEAATESGASDKCVSDGGERASE